MKIDWFKFVDSLAYIGLAFFFFFFFFLLIFFFFLVAASARLGEWCRFSNAFVGTGRAHNRDFIDASSSVEIGGTFTLEAWIWGMISEKN
jgi:hypothetical protein